MININTHIYLLIVTNEYIFLIINGLSFKTYVFIFIVLLKTHIHTHFGRITTVIDKQTIIKQLIIQLIIKAKSLIVLCIHNCMYKLFFE